MKYVVVYKATNIHTNGKETYFPEVVEARTKEEALVAARDHFEKHETFFGHTRVSHISTHQLPEEAK